jgi:cytoskeletal protein CcmA (bactofilin family)
MTRRPLPDDADGGHALGAAALGSCPALRLDVWASPAERGGPIDSECLEAPAFALPPASPALRAGAMGAPPSAPAGPATLLELVLEEALIVPAGAVLRGHVSARALVLAGEIVGSVHCGAGPVVICAHASLKGQLIAGGDVYICGSVIDYAGGTVISTPARLVLAPGASVAGDVRSGRIELYEGAMLQGAARAFEK